MFINLLLLLSALSLSSIAGYYSVIGMTAIFASAWWPVVIMTGMLEFSKVVVATWLHRNWSRTPFLLRSYLAISVIVLMFITSLGIFGFLSKAHIEQTSGIGNNQLFIAQIDQQIKVEQGRIEDSRRVIQQMDDAVNSLLKASTQQASARNANVAQQAARLRQSQAKDRAVLNSSIDESNTKIRALNNQKLKLDQEQLKLEVEVGPIKYIAEMIYGNNPDKDLLEKAVRYVIILIIFVFDPLAILMIIAASMSFSNRKKMDPEPESKDRPSGELTAPMTYQQAEETLRASDQRNGFAWTDHQATTVSAASIAMHYPQAASAPSDQSESPKPIAANPVIDTIKVETSEQLKISEIPLQPAKTDIQQVIQPTIIQETDPSTDPSKSDAVIQETDQTKADVIIQEIDPSTDQTKADVVIQEIDPSTDQTKADVIIQETDLPKEPETDVQSSALQPTGDGLLASKPDDLLQKIKQYHSLRLEDARRSIR